jgi:hypothetical protein
MIDPKIKVNWPNKELFEKAPEIFREEKRNALLEAGLLLEREIKERTPVGVTGLLRSSVAAQLYGDRVTIGTSFEYAEPVEYGSKAHWAPRAALEAWGIKKLGSEEAGRKVWYSIAHKGTRAALMFTRGFAMNYSKVMRILESIGEKVAARFNR